MGRKHKPWYQVARLQVWYWPVSKLMGPRPDSRLDCRFAYRRELTPSEGKNRRRVFEWIRKMGREPNGGHPDLRTIEEIIEAVDVHPNFQGTAAIYRSRFWELFLLDEIGPEEIMQRLNSFLNEHQLEKRSPTTISGYAKSGPFSRFSSDYQAVLTQSLGTMDALNVGYLECLLNFQKRAYGRHLGILEHEGFASNSLRKYLVENLIDQGESLYSQLEKGVNEIRVIKRTFGDLVDEGDWKQIHWPICKKGASPIL